MFTNGYASGNRNNQSHGGDGTQSFTQQISREVEAFGREVGYTQDKSNISPMR